MHCRGGGNIDKQRVYTFLDGEVITAIDGLASSKGVSRSEVIRIAIEQYITPTSPQEEGEDIILKDVEIAHLRQLLTIKEGEVMHLRGLTNDLRSLVDVMASKIPALPPGPEEIAAKSKSWYQFWK